jgi:PIN domain nuclease of toxin-antitoxin system
MVEGDVRRLCPDAIEAIDEAARRGELLVHAMSVWEIGMLVRKGRLVLSRPTADWVAEALGLPGIFLLGLSSGAALGATLLPDSAPGDPMDRILLAAAREQAALLVTADRQILAFAAEAGVRVLPASG